MSGLVRAARITLINGSALSKLVNQSSVKPLAANISSKAWREMNGVKRLPPYDYKNKPYNLVRSWFEKTSKRIDENSVIITVEGPIASGKTAFAEQLATELDMHFMPQATMDNFYITEYGVDLRQFDKDLSDYAKSFDEKKFLATPNSKRVASFQYHMYQNRFSEYMDGLAHLFSTGQGVVMERSPYTDIVFLETLYRTNLISKAAYKGLLEIRGNSLHELMMPHLIVYLDVPVNKTLENIKKRNKWGEANSPLFKDTKFLETMEESYKVDLLKSLEPFSELLVYDWSNGGDIELVVEDIEKIDMTNYTRDLRKLADWRALNLESDWNEARIKYTDDNAHVFTNTILPLYHIEELTINPDDYIPLNDVYEKEGGNRYAYGYNENMGDKDVITKSKKVNTPHKKNDWII